MAENNDFAPFEPRTPEAWALTLERAAVFIWVTEHLADQPGTAAEKTETMRRLRDAGEVEFVDLVDEDDNVVGFDILTPEEVERRLEPPSDPT